MSCRLVGVASQFFIQRSARFVIPLLLAMSAQQLARADLFASDVDYGTPATHRHRVAEAGRVRGLVIRP
jgi:hypothetical protein